MAVFFSPCRQIKCNEESNKANQYVLCALDDDGMLIGKLADDCAGGGYAAGGVDCSADPGSGNFLYYLRIIK